MRLSPLLTVLSIGGAACSSAVVPALDGAPEVDSTVAPVDGPVDSPPGAYRHTITIDGIDDFVAAETFTTTSGSYVARVAWDDTHVYLGYSGPDLDPAALDTATKWLFAYIDLDPGASTGSTSSLIYNTQAAAFPTGFGAELYVRWKCDTTFTSIEELDGATSTTIGSPDAGRSGTFLELAIPRTLFGGAETIGITTWMINEKPTFEGSFAGLYAGNFTDGYAASLPLTKYLRVDFASLDQPNAAGNQAP